MKIPSIILCGLIAACSCGGPARPPRVPEPVAQVVTHRVEEGESWRSLARDFYGDESRAEDIARSNGMDISVPPRPGAAVRLSLGGRDVARLQRRLESAREYNAGLDLAGEGNYAAAAMKFEEALKLDPAFADASFNLALAHGKLGMHARAIGILRDLLETAPRSAAYRYALGAAHFAAGELEAAEGAFREVLAAEPGHAPSLFSLATVCERRGKKDEAMRRYEEYLAIEREGEWAEAARARLEALRRSTGGGR